MSVVVLAESIVSGTNSGHGTVFKPAAGVDHNVFITAIAGALIAERSFDGINFYPVSIDGSGTAGSWTATTTFTIKEPEEGMSWRFTTANSATYRVSRGYW